MCVVTGTATKKLTLAPYPHPALPSLAKRNRRTRQRFLFQVLEDPACDREVAVFGYVRGTHLKAGQRVHVIGAGDFGMAEVTALEDPCPLPTKEKVANRCGDAYV